MTLQPDDAHNRGLMEQVRPPGWINPEPAGRYHLVVIGAGPAGLITAAVAAGLGARVALVERHLMGGDCLNTGCVPSKALIRAARAWADIHNAAAFGVRIPRETAFDFSQVMSRMRALRTRISPMDSAVRYREMGVDVFFGTGVFTRPDRVEVEGRNLKFSRAVICTGSRPVPPRIPGLSEAGCLTNETIFNLTERPRRMGVIGAGPLGCEMAQTFARFGTRISLFEQADQILPREDTDAAAVVFEQMKRDGVEFVMESEISGVESRGGEKTIRYRVHGEEKEIAVDEILASTGRAPRVQGLGLESAGVTYDSRKGIRVNHRLQTTNRRIYAAGDICFPFKFTHAAEAMAQIVVQNALFPHPLGLGVARTDSLIIPWCTYTDPEVAHVGMYESEARMRGISVQTLTVGMDTVDRAILDGEDRGFARILVKKGTDRILGATLVASHAGEMISEITLAMQAGAGLADIARTIHPYPTRTEVLRKVAYAWRKGTLTRPRRRLLEKWFRWTLPSG